MTTTELSTLVNMTPEEREDRRYRILRALADDGVATWAELAEMRRLRRQAVIRRAITETSR